MHPYKREELGADNERARLRTEFEQLQREFRNMEATRKAYAEESLSVIKKQKDLIEKLSSDNDSVKGELDVELRYLARKPASEANSHVLHDQLDLYIGKVEIEHRNIDSLTKQLEILRTKVTTEAKVIGGVNAAKDAEKNLEKKARVLETRLEKALQRFNEALAANKDLRAQIDTLRQERGVFESVYRKLERELAEKKRAMANMIESSNQAYEARDVAQMEVSKILQETNAERIVFEKQLAAMDAAVDAEVDVAKMEEFEMRGSMTIEQEEAFKRDLKEGLREIELLSSSVKVLGGKVDAYEIAFTKIRDETGIDEVEELVSVFLKNEDANFALFNYVGEQTAEYQRYEEALSLLRKEAMNYETGRAILSAQGQSGVLPLKLSSSTRTKRAGAPSSRGSSPFQSTRTSSDTATNSEEAGAPATDGESSTAVVAVEAAPVVPPPTQKALAPTAILPNPSFSASQNQLLLSTRSSAERAESRLSQIKTVVDAVRTQLSEMVTSVGADTLPGADLLLTNGSVPESNVLKVLGLIEQRAVALLSGYAALMRAAEEEAKEARLASLNVGSRSRSTSPVPEAEKEVTDLARLHSMMDTRKTSAGESPERRSALNLMGHGPVSKPGATNDRLHPTSLPAVADFAKHDQTNPNAKDDDEDLEDDDDEGGPNTRPLTLEQIRQGFTTKSK